MEEHPAVEMLELFALRRLSAENMMELLRHLDGCESCRAALRYEIDYIEALRAALRASRDDGDAALHSPVKHLLI